MRARSIVFTVFGDDPLLLLDPSLWPHCTYCVYQREVCPKTSREHFQGYMELDTQVAYSTLHTYEGLDDAHFEPRRGSQLQAIHYCSKPNESFPDDISRVEGPWYFGEAKQQGQRADLIAVSDSIRKGASLKRIAMDHPAEFLKYPSGIKSMQLLFAPRRTEETICFVFYGAGGTGKTTFAHLLARYLGSHTYVVPAAKGSGLYWDGYQQGDVCIIDEFKGNRMQPTEFNMLIDRVPCQVPIHGGTMEFNSRFVIITTNVSPRHWWPGIQFQKSLRRRIVLFPIFRNLGFRAVKSRKIVTVLARYPPLPTPVMTFHL